MYYIYDCNNELVGRVYGYKTIKSLNNAVGQLRNKLWIKFYERCGTGHTGNMVYRTDNK